MAKKPKTPLTRVSEYARNAAKETKQAVKAWSNSFDASDNARFGTKPGEDQIRAAAKASVARKKQDKEFGQAAGAILQGRRYDRFGKQIKK